MTALLLHVSVLAWAGAHVSDVSTCSCNVRQCHLMLLPPPPPLLLLRTLCKTSTRHRSDRSVPF
jgi:hypothetical protein